MLCAVDYIFNLLCAFNCLQPMKKSYFPLRPETLVGYKLSRVDLGTRMGLMWVVKCATSLYSTRFVMRHHFYKNESYMSVPSKID